MSHTSAAALRTTYWVFQIGSKLARSACGTKRNTRAAPRCAIAGAASAPAPTTPAAALMNVRRSMRTLRRWRNFGAGEGIRTLDPNLGKVGRYGARLYFTALFSTIRRGTQRKHHAITRTFRGQNPDGGRWRQRHPTS